MKAKIIYLTLGLTLITSYLISQPQAPSQQSIDLVKASQAIDSQALWPGYDISRYPIDIRFKDQEFRYQDGSFTQQNNQLDPIGYTAYLDDQVGPVIKIAPLEDYAGLAEWDGSDPDQIQAGYLATIAHEGFHCYQFEHGLAEWFYDDSEVEVISEEDLARKQDLINQLENDPDYQALWLAELESLSQGRDDYLNLQVQRQAYEADFLGADYPYYQDYMQLYELMEGTAKYVEHSYRYGDQPLELTGFFTPGTVRFYESGALKAQALDRLNPNWQALAFDGSINLEELLLKELQE